MGEDGRRPAPARGKVIPPSVGDEVDRELAFHLEMREAELVAQGWGVEEARAEALRRFGDRERVKELCMDIETTQRRRKGRSHLFAGITQDVGFAVRTLLRSPGFTLVALLTLALGIGINTAVFSVVNGVLLRPLDHPDAHRLVRIDERSVRGNPNAVAWPNFVDWRADARGFSGMAAYAAGSATLQGDGSPERVIMARVSEDFFGVMQVVPALGRTFAPGEEASGAAPVAVISNGLWQRMFGGTQTLDGMSLRSGSAGIPVVGVLPPGFDFPAGAEAWIPVDVEADPGSRTAHNWRVVARLADGITLDQAAAEVEGLTQRMSEVHAGQINARGAVVKPLRETLVGDVRRPLLLLLGASALVLLVACCNLMSTLLARAATRQREMAIRTSLGAGRGRMIRQLLTESAVLTGAGAVLGLLLSLGLLRLFVMLAPAGLPRVEDVAIDLPVLLFTTGISVATALIFGLVPALQATRQDLRDTMDQGGRSGSARRPIVWDVLVGAEVALALVLLVGSGLLVRSFVSLTAVDPGFDPQGVLTVGLTLPPPQDGDPDAADRLALNRWDEILPGVAAVPGVEAVGVINALPFSGQGSNGLWMAADAVSIPDGFDPGDIQAFVRAIGPVMEGVSERIRAGEVAVGGDAGYRVVGGDYFQVMGIPLVEGRAFLPSDHYDAPHVAVINRSMAERHWPGESPLGRRILTGGMDRFGLVPTEIVGVVGDVYHFGPASPPSPEYFLHAGQRPPRGGSVTLVLRGQGDPAPLAPAVRTRLTEAAPDIPVSFVTMHDRMATLTGRERFSMMVFGAFGALALVLAAVGIYGVVAYAVARRTREMGIRIALGASPGNVRTLVMRGSLLAVLTGVAAGVVMALNLGGPMQGMLHQVDPRDPWTFGVVAALLLATAWMATLIPALRGTRVDPMVTMRTE